MMEGVINEVVLRIICRKQKFIVNIKRSKTTYIMRNIIPTQYIILGHIMRSKKYKSLQLTSEDRTEGKVETVIRRRRDYII